MPAVKEKDFEERVRYFGAGNFEESGREHQFYFLGVRVPYRVAHGKSKRREVPVGGPLGVDYVARKMAEIAKSRDFPHGGNIDYFKKALKGYTPIRKLRLLEKIVSALILIFASFFISFAFLMVSNRMTGYAVLNIPSKAPVASFFIVFLIAVAVIYRLLFWKK